MVSLVKRRGHKERFDEKKVYGSVYAACASAHYDEMRCEKTAERILKKIKALAARKKELDSRYLREKIGDELRRKDKELAFYYEGHLPNLKRL